MKLSLCMIVKDEEPVLRRCLDGAGWADEIVILDTGSSDRTEEIAREYTPLVFSEPWKEDFSAARNASFLRATGDFLVWLDADDYVSPEEGKKIPALKRRLEEEGADMVMCPYEAGGLRYYRERFLRNGVGFFWEGRVHECIAPRGKTVRSDFTVRHLGSKKERGDRNLRIYRKWEKEEPLSGRDLFYYGRELYYRAYYAEAEEKLHAMLAGEGWYVNKIEACRVLADCLLAQGRREEALLSLFRSFLYGEPRAGVLCAAGDLFFFEGRDEEAAFWYSSALACRDHAAEGDFEEPEKRGLYPLLQLVVCKWRTGDREGALLCHKKTEELAPEHPSVVYNRRFFGV